MRKLAWLSFLAVALCSQVPGQQVLPSINLHRASSTAESAEWQRVRKSTDLNTLRSFQARYPNGRYSAQVERRITQLQREAADRGEPVDTTLATSQESKLV